MYLFKFLTISTFMVCFFGKNLEAIPAPNDSPSSTDVTIYEHRNFEGISSDLHLFSKVCQNIPENFRTILSSVKVQKDHCVNLYKGLNCEGEPYSACKDITDLDVENRSYNDHVQSIMADIRV
ncbi:12305_t:CDS:2 [Ambispora gerdemannii]|uniref:12305_t:CDS:1 n=1 Tax=Ambispora gerdemannii TaxID=144530 RepID=A0A9N9BLU0_9GLOM|nr:12305_t:CDS:2 [Ambispora gerdemannii]